MVNNSRVDDYTKRDKCPRVCIRSVDERVDVSNKQLKREVFAFLARSDCSKVTRKQVRDELEKIHGVRFDFANPRYAPSFKNRKEDIKDAITEYLTVVDEIAKSQEAKTIVFIWVAIESAGTRLVILVRRIEGSVHPKGKEDR